MLVSATILYEDVDFKTLSGRYTNSRMVPFLTHIDGVRANLFSINRRQKKYPHYGKSTVAFFTVKLDAKNSFPSNMAEVRQIYVKMGHIMRKSAFVICEQQSRRSACASMQSDQRLCCLLPG